MKIGYDAKRYFNNTTGLGNYARWLVDSISKNTKVHLTLFHTTPVKNPPFEVKTPTSIYKIIKGLWRSKFICSDIRSSGVDVFHGLSNELPFGIHKVKVKTVVTIHDLINMRYPEYYNCIDLYIYKRKLSYAIKHADSIVTPSIQTKTDIIKFFRHKKENIKVIPLSIDDLDIKPSKSQTPESYILCVSSFTQRKNLETLIKGYIALQEEKIKLVIAGKKGETYNSIVRACKGVENITLMTDVSNKTLTTLYQESLFCVYPSLFEGFGIPILEAFKYGKTIATSNISSMPEVGGKAALYFNPHKVEEISQALSTLLNPKERKKLESYIPDQLETFDSERLIGDYTDLYYSVIAK